MLDFFNSCLEFVVGVKSSARRLATPTKLGSRLSATLRGARRVKEAGIGQTLRVGANDVPCQKRGTQSVDEIYAKDV
jgi:hypothetical protein